MVSKEKKQKYGIILRNKQCVVFWFCIYDRICSKDILLFTIEFVHTLVWLYSVGINFSVLEKKDSILFKNIGVYV